MFFSIRRRYVLEAEQVGRGTRRTSASFTFAKMRQRCDVVTRFRMPRGTRGAGSSSTSFAKLCEAS